MIPIASATMTGNALSKTRSRIRSSNKAAGTTSATSASHNSASRTTNEKRPALLS